MELTKAMLKNLIATNCLDRSRLADQIADGEIVIIPDDAQPAAAAAVAATPVAAVVAATPPKPTKARGGRKNRNMTVARGGSQGKGKYNHLWKDGKKVFGNYLGTYAPVGQNAVQTGSMRDAMLESLIPGFTADPNVKIVHQGKDGADKFRKGSELNLCINIPFTYIQLCSSKQAPVIAGVAHSEVCKILAENGYKFCGGSQKHNKPPAWVCDSNGHPATNKNFGKTYGGATSALCDD